MNLQIFLLIGVSSLIIFSRAWAELISSLPGQPANVSFKQYSGYIVTDSEHGRALFYYFVEANSANPLSHPLTLWLNGGPGCSSLGFGAFMEHGPFQPGEDEKLNKNSYSWNLESNMLYVESPAGVGFSYSNTSSDYVNRNDTTTAEDNLQFMLNWFKEFPDYRDLDLYLTGESYAGHYIPQLAALLLDYNRRPNVKPIKLKAIMLGNPLLDTEISLNAAEFLWSHGVISDKMLVLRRTVCSDTRYITEWIHQNLSKECVDVHWRLNNMLGADIDLGDLILPNCIVQSVGAQSVSLGQHDTIHAKLSSRVAPGDPCLGDRVHTYLNNLQVQRTLHANTTHLPNVWEFCSRALDYQKESIANNIIPLVSELLKDGIRILLYSGDQDSKIPLTQTRIIASMLAQSLELVSLGEYTPWYDKLQVGGWTQSYGKLKEGKNVTCLTFATVRGAAHEVPFTSPSQALTLFRAFLRGYLLIRNQMLNA
ncbi:Peptidase S10, serine carboxypeptidase [Dillenia turbinata]|uniref:Carboxypeptidase n=1 Tax=Dillenia turbinata TaxID=194707 RepID=A0AAN8URZ2_9MAGN